MNIKEVIFFTYGDANSASTWSNVPYLFTSTLEKKGITVHRINLLEGTSLVGSIFDKTISRLYRIFHKGTSFSYIRSRLFRTHCLRKIKHAVKQYPNADYCFFACLDFQNEFSDTPSLLFSDWSYEVLIRNRRNHQPDTLEQRYIDWQNSAMTAAEKVVVMFPKSCDYINRYCTTANAFHPGQNVVNDMLPLDSTMNADLSAVIQKKREMHQLLFIGGKSYLHGAKLLVKAFCEAKKQIPDLKLKIVGLTDTDLNLPSATTDVECMGYLRKDNPLEREKYYTLLQESSIFINPTQIWGGYSSTIEAMYYYTPVIVAEYEDFSQEFGNNINFGKYLHSESPFDLSKLIVYILKSAKYDELCRNAHKAVANYTWENYVQIILNHAEL